MYSDNINPSPDQQMNIGIETISNVYWIREIKLNNVYNFDFYAI